MITNSSGRFGAYLHELREGMMQLIEYQERTGTIQEDLAPIKEALFDSDPFIVFGATLAATVILSDKSLYH